MPVWFFGGILWFILAVVASYDGFSLLLPGWIAAVLTVACVLLRIDFVSVPAAFFGAWLSWHWPWYWAFGFAAPGLALFLPVFAGSGILALFGAAWNKLTGNRPIQ